MPGSVYVLGGRQRRERARHEWQRYDQAIILEVDLATGHAEVVQRYETPATAAPVAESPAILFKAGTLQDGVLYTCTGTEVIGYAVPSMRRVLYISHPWFNDLHHVRPLANGDLAVVSTGLDAVFVLSAAGEVKREWSTSGTPIWDRFSQDVDYRFVLTTKPHSSHPNFCFILDGALWVTRFEQRDAICLEDPQASFSVEIQRPHDGIVHGGQVYFTTVDGHVVVFDAATRGERRAFDLNEISRKETALGWCRGILPVGGDVVIVGFSRIRATRFAHTVSWLRHRITSAGQAGVEKTRIAAFDLKAGTLLWEYPLEEYDCNVLFSIHSVPEQDAAAG